LNNFLVVKEAKPVSRYFIQTDNIGYKLLQKSGWTGGGLGAKGQGMNYPIAVNQRNNRTNDRACLGAYINYYFSY
jgi:hypothetical protein